MICLGRGVVFFLTVAFERRVGGADGLVRVRAFWEDYESLFGGGSRVGQVEEERRRS